MTLPEMLDTPAAALTATGIWLCLAVMFPLLGLRRHSMAMRGLVLLGVPTLGWLTLLCGPVIGVAGFVLGALVLIARPMVRGAARRRMRADRHLVRQRAHRHAVSRADTQAVMQPEKGRQS